MKGLSRWGLVHTGTQKRERFNTESFSYLKPHSVRTVRAHLDGQKQAVLE